jgi:tetratricopeptide (TPR) repeat protein
VVAVIASSSAAAALSANWRDIASWLAPSENAVAGLPTASPPPQAHVGSVAKNDPKPAPSEAEPPAIEEPVVEAAATAERRHAAKLVPRPSVPGDIETTEAATAPQAEDLLGAANSLRAQRRYPEALAKYLEVVRKHPGSPQAAAARVSAATLRLEHDNDADGALELLEGAPSGRSAIPEAEYLLAESYRAQGKDTQESQALRRFLSESPDHPLASKARRRLEILKREPTEKPR